MSNPPHTIRFNASTGSLTAGERSALLTGVERKLVAMLFDRLGEAISHQEIRDGVWGENWAGGDEALRVTVNRIRTKIETNRRKPEIIVSVRGIGYRMLGVRG